MFTGIIERLGVVRRVTPVAGGLRLAIDVGDFAGEMKAGDSLAVNGACLTVTATKSQIAQFDVVKETASKTNLPLLKPESKVNLERPLAVGERLHGHFVLGHVDGTATLTEKRNEGAQTLMLFAADPDITREMISKGSVAVDGISLTVAELRKDGFSVAVIPETIERTTLGIRSTGEKVNVELDVLGKYVKRMFSSGETGLSREFLTEHGFG
jgi:riboflavin synthase